MQFAAVMLSMLCGTDHREGAARADALVVTRAMQATTIAEIHLDRGTIRAELEIGLSELPAFRNLLPLELQEGNSEEVSDAISDHWAIRLDDGEPLTGRLVRADRRKRIARDEITGDPLPRQPEDAADVVTLEIAYEFEGEPATFSIRPPMRAGGRYAAADIGFVVYDRGIPVNDFRYLGQEETMDLDWEDPWYSRFRNRNLVRQFDAPLSAFLYVEHFEVRQEIVLRPRDLQHWVDLGLEGRSVLPVKDQDRLKQRVVEFLLEHNPVTVDGRSVERRLDRIHFIRRSLRQTGIVDPPEDMQLDSATLGVIFVCPIDELPERVEMEWGLFSPKIQEIPAVASDEAGGLPSRITPEHPILAWRNYLTNPSSPDLMRIPPPPSRPKVEMPVVSVICGVVLIILLASLMRQRRAGGNASGGTLIAAPLVLLVGLAAWPYLKVSVTDPFSAPPRVSDTDASKLLGGLLSNVYRAFDHSDEEMIYDRLSQSVEGDLLSDIYLETRRSMEVRNQGGLRISVKEVTVQELESLEHDSSSEFNYRCRWRVSGWIGHWGHIHSRINEHVAVITLASHGEVWKITEIEMLDELPIDAGSGGAVLGSESGA